MPVVKANGIELNYIEAGKGEALVLVHNVISNIHGFDFNIPEFSKYYKTIAFDLRGHGGSTKAKTQEEASSFFTFENTADDLYELLKVLGVDSCYLLGQAFWGVSTISYFFQKHPEMVKALIPVSCDLNSQREEKKNFNRLREKIESGIVRMQEIARSEGMPAVFEARKTLKTFWSDKVLNTPEIMERFEQMYRETPVLTFLNFPVMPDARRHEIAAAFAETNVPVMLVMGVEDSIPFQMARNLKQDCPQLHTVFLPECGHYPAIENPYDFNLAVLNFLAGVHARR
jgi:3-oxoadipate enol-lactonase